jgi:hypothetical protein
MSLSMNTDKRRRHNRYDQHRVCKWFNYLLLLLPNSRAPSSDPSIRGGIYLLKGETRLLIVAQEGESSASLLWEESARWVA